MPAPTAWSLLSRTAVSEITERLWAEYEAFAGRDLSEFAVSMAAANLLSSEAEVLTELELGRPATPPSSLTILRV